LERSGNPGAGRADCATDPGFAASRVGALGGARGPLNPGYQIRSELFEIEEKVIFRARAKDLRLGFVSWTEMIAERARDPVPRIHAMQHARPASGRRADDN
jgi:hypothetical protein